MKTVALGMMVMLLNLGTAHAEPVKPLQGFDRVGVASSHVRPAAVDTPPTAAPGEGADQGSSHHARKREMARRLVWLMLSAR